MSTSFNDVPHIYIQKKYIALTRQDVARGEKAFLYSGGNGVLSCIQQLNNLNHVCGNTLITVDTIARQLGIKLTTFKDRLEGISIPDQGLKSLVEDQVQTMKILSQRISHLEDKISNIPFDKITNLLEQMQKLNPDVLQELL